MLTMRVAAHELFHEAYLQEAAVLCTKKSKYKRMLQKNYPVRQLAKKSCPVQQQTDHTVSKLQCHERQIILILAGLQAKRTWATAGACLSPPVAIVFHSLAHIILRNGIFAATARTLFQHLSQSHSPS